MRSARAASSSTDVSRRSQVLDVLDDQPLSIVAYLADPHAGMEELTAAVYKVGPEGGSRMPENPPGLSGAQRRTPPRRLARRGATYRRQRSRDPTLARRILESALLLTSELLT